MPFNGIEVVYYLVHAMGYSSDFGQSDRSGDLNTVRAAERAVVSSIVYLGGTGPEDPPSYRSILPADARSG
jgi:hypothetical protein